VQESVVKKTRPELRPKKNEEKKHRRVPACNLQPSQFNFDRGLQYEYQKHRISTFIKFQTTAKSAGDK
jgi:hypothetical protein